MEVEYTTGQWSDQEVSALLDIFEFNRQYSMVTRSISLYNHISTLLITLYDFNRSPGAVEHKITFLYNIYSTLNTDYYSGRISEIYWPYFYCVEGIVFGVPACNIWFESSAPRRFPNVPPGGEALMVQEPAVQYQGEGSGPSVPPPPPVLDPTQLLGLNESWTVAELDLLLRIYEQNDDLHFSQAYLSQCEQISDILWEQHQVTKTPFETQSIVRRCQNRAKPLNDYTVGTSTFPYIQRIYRLYRHSIVEHPIGFSASSWTKREFDGLTKIFEENHQYSFITPSLRDCYKISTMLSSSHNVYRSGGAVYSKVDYLYRIFTEHSQSDRDRRSMERTWSLYTRIEKLVERSLNLHTVESSQQQFEEPTYPLEKQPDPTYPLMKQPDPTEIQEQDDEFDPSQRLCYNDTWTVGELDSLLTVYEQNDNFNFRFPYMEECEVVAHLMYDQNKVITSGSQVCNKVCKLFQRAQVLVDNGYTPATSKFPYMWRILKLHNRT